MTASECKWTHGGSLIEANRLGEETGGRALRHVDSYQTVLRPGKGGSAQLVDT